MVVKRPPSEFSGRIELRTAVRFGEVVLDAGWAAESSALDSVGGMETL